MSSWKSVLKASLAGGSGGGIAGIAPLLGGGAGGSVPDPFQTGGHSYPNRVPLISAVICVI